MLKRTKSGKLIAATLVTALSTMALVGCGAKAESSNGGEDKKPVSTADFVSNTKPVSYTHLTLPTTILV